MNNDLCKTIVYQMISVKPRVMTPQSSVNFPKIDLKSPLKVQKQYKKRVLRAVFALRPDDGWALNRVGHLQAITRPSAQQ